ncbi:MAG: hypothetical protein ACOCQ1_01240 [Halanaerobiaceae bacterium]
MLKLFLSVLIIIVSLQLVLKQETGLRRFENAKQVWQKLFITEQQAIKVSEKDDTLAGMVTIKVKQGTSLPRARLFINGKETDSFAAGEVDLRVQDGDLVLINTSNYEHEVEFIVQDSPQQLTTLKKGAIFQAEGDWVVLGVMKFDDKL